MRLPFLLRYWCRWSSRLFIPSWRYVGFSRTVGGWAPRVLVFLRPPLGSAPDDILDTLVLVLSATPLATAASQAALMERVVHTKLSRKPLLVAFLQSVVLPLFRGDAQFVFISLTAPLLFETLLAPATGSGASLPGASQSLPLAQRLLERLSSLLLYVCVALAVLAAKAMLWKPGRKLRTLLAGAQVFVPGAYYVFAGLLNRGGARFHIALPVLIAQFALPVAAVGFMCTHGAQLLLLALSRRLPRPRPQSSGSSGVFDTAARVGLAYAVSCVSTLWAIAAGDAIAIRVIALSCAHAALRHTTETPFINTAWAAESSSAVNAALTAEASSANASLNASSTQSGGSSGGSVSAFAPYSSLHWWNPQRLDTLQCDPLPLLLSQRGMWHSLFYTLPLLLLLLVILVNYAWALTGLWRVVGTLNVKWSLPALGAVRSVRLIRDGGEGADDDAAAGGYSEEGGAASRAAAALGEVISLITNPSSILTGIVSTSTSGAAGGTPAAATAAGDEPWFERVSAVLQRIEMLQLAGGYDVGREEWHCEVELSFPVTPGDSSATIPAFNIVLASLFGKVKGWEGWWTTRLHGEPYPIPVVSVRSRAAVIPSASEYRVTHIRTEIERERQEQKFAAEAATAAARECGADPESSAALAMLLTSSSSNSNTAAEVEVALASSCGNSTSEVEVTSSSTTTATAQSEVDVGAIANGTAAGPRNDADASSYPSSLLPADASIGDVAAVALQSPSRGDGGGSSGSPIDDTREGRAAHVLSFSYGAADAATAAAAEASTKRTSFSSDSAEVPTSTSVALNTSLSHLRQRHVGTSSTAASVGSSSGSSTTTSTAVAEASAAQSADAVAVAASPSARLRQLWHSVSASLTESGSRLMTLCTRSWEALLRFTAGTVLASDSAAAAAAGSRISQSRPPPPVEQLPIVFDVVVLGTLVRPFIKAARAALARAQAHVKKGAMSRAIEEFKPESFLKRLSENGHLVGYAAYIEVELGGHGADGDDDDGDGGAYAVDAELSSSSSSLSGLRYVDWCISRIPLVNLMRVGGRVHIPLVRWVNWRLQIDSGSPLSLLYSSGGVSSGSGSGLSGGLAIRSDILDGLTGVVMQVPLDRLQQGIEKLITEIEVEVKGSATSVSTSTSAMLDAGDVTAGDNSRHKTAASASVGPQQHHHNQNHPQQQQQGRRVSRSGSNTASPSQQALQVELRALLDLRDTLREYRWRIWVLNEKLNKDPNLRRAGGSGSSGSNSRGPFLGRQKRSQRALGSGFMPHYDDDDDGDDDAGGVSVGPDITHIQRQKERAAAAAGGRIIAPSSSSSFSSPGATTTAAPSSPSLNGTSTASNSAAGVGLPRATPNSINAATAAAGAAAQAADAFERQVRAQAETAAKPALQQIGEAVGVLVRLQKCARTLFQLQLQSGSETDLHHLGGPQLQLPQQRLLPLRHAVHRDFNSVIKSANGLLSLILKAGVFTALDAARNSSAGAGSGAAASARKARPLDLLLLSGTPMGALQMGTHAATGGGSSSGAVDVSTALNSFTAALGSVSPVQLALFALGVGSLLRQMYTMQKEAKVAAAAAAQQQQSLGSGSGGSDRGASAASSSDSYTASESDGDHHSAATEAAAAAVRASGTASVAGAGVAASVRPNFNFGDLEIVFTGTASSSSSSASASISESSSLRNQEAQGSSFPSTSASTPARDGQPQLRTSNGGLGVGDIDALAASLSLVEVEVEGSAAAWHRIDDSNSDSGLLAPLQTMRKTLRLAASLAPQASSASSSSDRTSAASGANGAPANFSLREGDGGSYDSSSDAETADREEDVLALHRRSVALRRYILDGVGKDLAPLLLNPGLDAGAAVADATSQLASTSNSARVHAPSTSTSDQAVDNRLAAFIRALDDVNSNRNERGLIPLLATLMKLNIAAAAACDSALQQQQRQVQPGVATPETSTSSPGLSRPSNADLAAAASTLKLTRRIGAAAGTSAPAAATPLEQPPLPWNINSGFSLKRNAPGAAGSTSSTPLLSPTSTSNRGAVGEGLKETLRAKATKELSLHYDDIMRNAHRLLALQLQLGNASPSALPSGFLQANIARAPGGTLGADGVLVPGSLVERESLTALCAAHALEMSAASPVRIDAVLDEFEGVIETLSTWLPRPESQPLPHVYDCALADDRRVLDLIDDKGMPKVWDVRCAYTGRVARKEHPYPDADADALGAMLGTAAATTFSPASAPGPTAAASATPASLPNGNGGTIPSSSGTTATRGSTQVVQLEHASPFTHEDRRVLSHAYVVAHALGALLDLRHTVANVVTATDTALLTSASTTATPSSSSSAAATGGGGGGGGGGMRGGPIGGGVGWSHDSLFGDRVSGRKGGILTIIRQAETEKFAIKPPRPMLKLGPDSFAPVDATLAHALSVVSTGLGGPAPSQLQLGDATSASGQNHLQLAAGDNDRQLQLGSGGPFALPLPVTAAYVFHMRARLWDCAAVVVDSVVQSAEDALSSVDRLLANTRSTLDTLTPPEQSVRLVELGLNERIRIVEDRVRTARNVLAELKMPQRDGHGMSSTSGSAAASTASTSMSRASSSLIAAPPLMGRDRDQQRSVCYTCIIPARFFAFRKPSSASSHVEVRGTQHLYFEGGTDSSDCSGGSTAHWERHTPVCRPLSSGLGTHTLAVYSQDFDWCSSVQKSCSVPGQLGWVQRLLRVQEKARELRIMMSEAASYT